MPVGSQIQGGRGGLSILGCNGVYDMGDRVHMLARTRLTGTVPVAA